jgi:uncharacterized RDD family membrane protein YckC
MNSSRRPTLAQALPSSQASLYLSVAFIIAAIVVGLNTPGLFPLALLQEGGPIETGTVFLYVAAALCVLLVRLPLLSTPDRAAICIVLLAFAAREADLHSALFGVSILKARFYNHYATAGQIFAALAILLPIALSGLWLVKRHGFRWLMAPSRWQAPAVTLMTFLAVIIIAKGMDRLPDTLVALGVLAEVPSALGHAMQGIEEILEMELPLLAMLAMAQCRLQPRPESAKPPG